MNELFDMQTVLMDSPRLAEIKAADIQTHHAPHMEEDPWLAIPMHAARQRLKGYITKDDPVNTVADITASFGILLDDCGMLFYGETESEVQNAALAYVKLSSSGDVGNTTGGDSVPTEAPHQSGVIDGVEVPPVVKSDATHYLCERCGGMGNQDAGLWNPESGKYDDTAGTCRACNGSGYLGPLPKTTNQ